MKKLLCFFITFLIIILAACSAPTNIVIPSSNTSLADEATPTVLYTQTSLPVSTATATPKPTATKVPPTPTVEPPTKVMEVLNGVKVVKMETFQKSSSPLFNYGTGTKASGDGELNLQGITFWQSSFRSKSQFPEGTGIIFSYKYSPKSDFEIFFDRGEWGNPDYRRFGVYAANSPAANLWQGPQGLGFNYLSKNFSLKTDTWYNILLSVGKGGDFLALIWDPEEPERVARYHEVIKKWEDNTWNFTVGANEGQIIFKDYMEVTFSEYKK